MVRSNTIGRIQESEDLIIANEETVMAIDDYRLYVFCKHKMHIIAE